VVLPIAVQDSRELHDTPTSGPPGARSMDQVLPFQRSTSERGRRAGLRETVCPTAVQASGDAHDTLVSRLLSCFPDGAGTGSTDHADPFQPSTSGT
jgi:hypothetical protein